jgi:hypothetical protein
MIVPGGDAHQLWIPVQEGSQRLKIGEEVWRQIHVILKRQSSRKAF